MKIAVSFFNDWFVFDICDRNYIDIERHVQYEIDVPEEFVERFRHAIDIHAKLQAEMARHLYEQVRVRFDFRSRKIAKLSDL